MSEPRILPAAEPRVETGTVQFGDDWPGLFLRGKHCFLYAGVLTWAIRVLEESVGELPSMERMRLNQLKALQRYLVETRVGWKATPEP